MFFLVWSKFFTDSINEVEWGISTMTPLQRRRRGAEEALCHNLFVIFNFMPPTVPNAMKQQKSNSQDTMLKTALLNTFATCGE